MLHSFKPSKMETSDVAWRPAGGTVLTHGDMDSTGLDLFVQHFPQMLNGLRDQIKPFSNSSRSVFALRARSSILEERAFITCFIALLVGLTSSMRAPKVSWQQMASAGCRSGCCALWSAPLKGGTRVKMGLSRQGHLLPLLPGPVPMLMRLLGGWGGGRGHHEHSGRASHHHATNRDALRSLTSFS